MQGTEIGPRTWLVVGDKGGDNAQVATIAEQLPWPYETRFVAMRPRYVKGKPRVRPSLHHLDLEASDALEPPWPELIITVGRRPSLVALWIQQQAERQTGQRPQIVFIGKPSARMDKFDLVVASSEVLLPAVPNVQQSSLPLMQLDQERVQQGVEAWAERFAALPRPLIGFLIGGPTNPFRYNRGMARRLSGLAHQVAADGGTPYLTTSRRTPEKFMRWLQPDFPDAGRIYQWRPEDEDNPYSALLGSADGLIVTGDSISMAVEVARLGKPLGVLMPGYSPWGHLDRLRRWATRWLMVERPALGRALYRAHLLGVTRDYDGFYDTLIREGRAAWAGAELPMPEQPASLEVERVIVRIRELVSPYQPTEAVVS
jgi:mitochondrial fission protein ELM1